MPIKEFMCPKCLVITEDIFFRGDLEITKCKKCGRRLECPILSAPSAFNIHGYNENNGYSKKIK